MTLSLSAFAFAVAWKSLVVLGAAALAALAMRRSSAAARHLVWTLALAALLALPVAVLVVPDTPIAILPAPAAGALAQRLQPEAATVRAEPREMNAGPVDPAASDAGAAARGDAAQPASAPAFPRTLPAWLMLWTAGLALVFARLVAGYAWVAWSARRSERITAGAWRTLVERLARTIGLASEPPLLRAPGTAMPMAWGVLRPVVLLPGGADAWPDDRREVVLLHELAHIRRRDCLTQALAQTVCALYWFNPLVWLAARRLRAERELACDDLVLQSGAEGPSYAAHLLELARTLRDVRGGALATVAMARRSELEGRLLAILNPARDRRAPGRHLSAVLAISLVILLLPLAAVRPVAGAAVAATVVPADAPPDLAMETSPKLPADEPANPMSTQPAGASREPASEPASEPESGPREPQLSGAAIEALMAALHDPDAGVRRAAIGALANLDDGRAVPALIEALGDESADVRRVAAAALSESGDPRAVDPLMAALDDDSPDVRRYVAIALGEIGDRRAVSALIGLLKDESADVRRYAAIALGELDDPSAVEPLMAAAGDASADVRRYAIITLGELDDPRAVPALTKALQDESADVRRYAAFALAELGASEAAEPLMAALGDTDADVRRFVVSALGDLRDRRALPGLIRALGDEAVDVRRAAASALGDLRDAQAVEPLAAALRDADADVRRAAVSALGDIGSRQTVQPLIALLRDEDPDVRRAAAYALGDLGDPAAIDALTAAMKDENAEVRRAAISAIADISGGGFDPNPNPNPRPDPDPDPNPNPNPTRPIKPRGGGSDLDEAMSGLRDGLVAGVKEGVAGGVSGGVRGGVEGGVEGGLTGGVDGGVEAGVDGGVAESLADVRVTQRYLVPLALDGQPVEAGVRRWRLTLGEHSLAVTMRNEPRTGMPDADPGIAVITFTPEAGHRYEVEIRGPADAYSTRVWVKGNWTPVVRDRTTDRIASGEPTWRGAGTGDPDDAPARRQKSRP